MGTETETDLKSAVLMFNWIEYLVFSTMLVLSALIGVYYGWFKKQDTVAEYMLGGKKMSIFPIAMSLIFSHISGVTLLGIPAEVYSYGTQYCAILFCNMAIVILVNYLYMPVFFHLQLNSLYEYLELRFCQGTRTLASFIFALSLIIFIPVVIYIPALAFNQVTGVSIHIITPIVSLICIFYTSYGGLKAVVWTDALQGVFTLAATSFVVVLGIIEIGSLSEVFRINSEGSRLEIFNMDLSPFVRNTFWGASVGSVFSGIAHLAVHPGAVQRFIAVSTLKESKTVMCWSFVGFFVIKGLAVLVGLLLYANYYDCDPVATKIVKKTGQILPLYVMGVAKDFPGLTGLFISGLLSAALSTMSAGLNTVAGTLYEDFVQFVLKDKKQTEAQQSFTLKIIVLVLGVICTSLVLVVERLGGIFQVAVSLNGVTSGALGGVFTLGLFFPRANSKGAMAGSFSSLLIMATIAGGAQYYKTHGHIHYPGKVTSVDGCPANFTSSLGFNASALVQTYKGVGSPLVADDSVPLVFQLSFMYFIMMGTLIVLVVGLSVSYLTEAPDLSTVDPHLFSPIVRRFLPPSGKPPAEEYKLVNTQPSSQDMKEPVRDTHIAET